MKHRKDLYSISQLKFAAAFAGLVLLTYLISCKDEDDFVPMKIFSVSPAEAMAGDTITLIGEGFSPGFDVNDVFFQGVTGKVIPLETSSTTRLMVRVPDGAQSGAIRVNILDDEIVDSPPITIIIPVIESITPDNGWIGDTVVIKGQHFRPELQKNNVRFNPIENHTATVISGSSTSLKVIVPESARTGLMSVLGYAGVNFKLNPPEIMALAPDQGIVGDTISIKGKGLNAGESALVIFTGNNATSTPLPESTPLNIRVIVPGGAIDGPLKIRNNTGEEYSTALVFKVYPSITNIFPRSGLAGTPVKISGFNFSSTPSENKVSFNGIEVPVNSATEKEIRVTVPTGITSGPVTVLVNERLATGPAFTVAAAGTPVVHQLQPDRGPAGSLVVLTGENFSATASQNTVQFSGDKPATIITASATELTLRVPDGAVSGPISVIKDGKTGISPDFTITDKALPVITSLNPQSVMRGATLTINGGNFSTTKEDISVTFTGGGTARSVVPQSAAEDQLSVIVPAGADLNPGEYAISVRQFDETSNNNKKVILIGQPVITSADIIQGTPGTVVTLTGTDFDLIESNNIVKFGNQVANLVNVNDGVVSKVSVYVPDVAPGIYNITLTAFGNTSNAISFTVKEKPVAVKNVFYSAGDDVIGSTAFIIKKAVFDPPSSATVYRTANGASLSCLAVDLVNKKVYLDETGALMRSNLNNTAKEELYNSSETGGTITDLSLDIANQKVYWSSGGPAIYSGNFNGSGTPELLFDDSDGLESTYGITYLPDDGKLYIADQNFTNGYRILRANADGSGTPEVLFDGASGLSALFDVKIDATAGKIFVLDIDESTGEYRLLTGKLDGSGALSALTSLGATQVSGISLDVQDQYIYWIQSDANGEYASIYRARYDFATIPGTNPPSSIQTVYSNIEFNPVYIGSIAVEESTKGGSTQRMRSMRLPLKFRLAKPK